MIGEPDRGGSPSRIGWTLVAAALATGLTACMTILNLGGRFVLGEGGFVARGGPYEIAHPAPDWIWLVPVSFMAGAAIVIVHLVAAKRHALAVLRRRKVDPDEAPGAGPPPSTQADAFPLRRKEPQPNENP